MSFSALHRPHIISTLRNTQLELLIIGGGITGAGIALDAASRGIKTALVEMQDFAGGTSSRSTKLIHGGLRYLKQFEFGLVAETGKERFIVHKNAPHLTYPEPMLLPLIKGGSLNTLAAYVGTWVYDQLAGVKKEERRKMLTKEETLEKEPMLRSDILKGGVYYYEYRTDDARLTIEILKSAEEHGAVCLNYAEASGFLYDEKRKLRGVVVRDVFSGQTIEIAADVIVNASGPWVDQVDRMDTGKKEEKLFLTKGVHLVFDRKRLPVRQPVYFNTQDGRMIFAIPRGNTTYAGTTDTPYQGDLKDPEVTGEDKAYLLKAVNHIFPALQLEEKDILSFWAGLRPLIRQKGKAPSAISRKDEIFFSSSGLITIAGGKLTSYRKMAERITDIAASRLRKKNSKKYPPCSTKDIVLSGGKTEGSFDEFLKAKTRKGKALDLDSEETTEIIRRFGSNAEQLFKNSEAVKEAKKYDIPVAVYAQLVYCMENEMALTPADFLVRRTGIVYFQPKQARLWKQGVIRCMSDYLKWNKRAEEKYSEEIRKLI